MFQHDASSACAKVALTGAYGFAVVVGTATLIALTDPQEWRQGEAATPTRAEAVMRQAAERALVSPKAALVAGNESSERRGH